MGGGREDLEKRGAEPGPSYSLCRPLHLAIIHEQTAVIKQLIEVIITIPSQQVINISNNLQQVHVSQSSQLSSTWGSLPFPDSGGSYCSRWGRLQG